MFKLALPLLLACVAPAFAQDHAPRDVLDGVLETLTTTTSGHLEFEGEVAGEPKSSTYEGYVYLGENGAFRLQLDMNMNGQVMSLTIICDGERSAVIQGMNGQTERERVEEEADLPRMFRSFLAHAGAMLPLVMARPTPNGPDEDTSDEPAVTVLDPTWAESVTEGETTYDVLRYGLAMGAGSRAELQVEAWVDPETGWITQRKISVEGEQGFGGALEVFTHWDPDAELPDDAFDVGE